MKLIFDVQDLSVSWRAQSKTSETDWVEVYSSLLQKHTPLINIPPHKWGSILGYWMKRCEGCLFGSRMSESLLFVCLRPLGFFKVRLHRLFLFDLYLSRSPLYLSVTYARFPMTRIKIRKPTCWYLLLPQESRVESFYKCLLLDVLKLDMGFTTLVIQRHLVVKVQNGLRQNSLVKMNHTTQEKGFRQLFIIVWAL